MNQSTMSQPNIIWSCPVCQGGLTLLDKTLACAAGHSFDRAKQGYFNLLLANQKGSANPGDDANMLGSRREFLAAGHFAPLAQALGNTLVDLLGGRAGEDVQLLDTGCGEGYYLAELQQRLQRELPEQRIGYAGSDISKEAAKLAARLHKSIEWSVASSFHLPVDNRSVDVLLRVFAPGDLEEVARVLKAGGHFLRVVPGAEHLLELKAALYDEVTLHELQPTPEGFNELSATEIRFDVELNDHASVQQLLTMTPFLWRGKREAREALQQAAYLKVGAHFVVQLYSLNEAPELASNTPPPSLEQLQAKRDALQEKYAAKRKKQADALAAKQEKARLAEVAKEKAAAFNWGASSKVAELVTNELAVDGTESPAMNIRSETVVDKSEIEKQEIAKAEAIDASNTSIPEAVTSSPSKAPKPVVETVTKSKPAFDWGTSSKVVDEPKSAAKSDVAATAEKIEAAPTILVQKEVDSKPARKPRQKPESKPTFTWAASSKVVGEVKAAEPEVIPLATEAASVDKMPSLEAVVEPQKDQTPVTAVTIEAEPEIELARQGVEPAKPTLNHAGFTFAPRTADEEKLVAERKQEEAVEKQVDEDVSSFLDEFVGRKQPAIQQKVVSTPAAAAVEAAPETHEEAAGKKAAKEKFNDKGFSF